MFTTISCPDLFFNFICVVIYIEKEAMAQYFQRFYKKENNLRILVITGPTASGKSELALRAAREFGGEIISADSMQVYRGLDKGTAKPSPEERRIVPHHMLDILDISESLDVYKYVESAEKCINEISARGNLPIIAGGSGFYIKALVYGLDPMPGNRALRKELDERFDNDYGFEELKKIMMEKDAASYDRWKSHRRKLIRAFEVFSLTGRSITGLQTLSAPVPRFLTTQFILSWEREELKKRIAGRTETMLSAGWIEETAGMISKGLFNSPTAHQALGYKEIAEYLNGKLTRLRLAEKISTATWQYARRQITWFKSKHPGAEILQMPYDYNDIKDKIRNSVAR